MITKRICDLSEYASYFHESESLQFHPVFGVPVHIHVPLGVWDLLLYVLLFHQIPGGDHPSDRVHLLQHRQKCDPVSELEGSQVPAVGCDQILFQFRLFVLLGDHEFRDHFFYFDEEQGSNAEHRHLVCAVPAHHCL